MGEQALRTVAFPKLSDEQIEAVGRCARATLTVHHAGQKLFAVGERDFKFFVIKSGEVEIVDECGETPRTVVVHGPGEFTGDVAHLTGHASIVSAVARTDTEAYEVSSSAVRDLLDRCAELGDVILKAFIARRQLVRESGKLKGAQVIGSRYSRDTFRIREFLAKNGVVFTWLDLEADPDVDRLLRRFGLREEDTPVVAWHRHLLRNPSNRQLAEALGIRRPLERKVYDLVVVGSGPAGLGAAVYGASEGLSTLVLERMAPGGQASASMRIENYLGFPTGVTGSELADRAVIQAHKFGALLSVPSVVTGVELDEAYPEVRLDDGTTVTAKCLLIASGADYRRLGVEGCNRYEGCGVYYSATLNEVPLCKGADVVVVGGGNSAGQAALFLAAHARKVYLLVRGDDLGRSMSAYLARRIQQTPNIEVLTNATVRWMAGNSHLRQVSIVNSKTGEERNLETPALFSFIGAAPRTDWLPPQIERDDKSFVRTGIAVADSRHWMAPRQPLLLETSRPGVFAAGDVRAGSVKRCASAVGEGAMSVQFVHEYLKAH